LIRDSCSFVSSRPPSSNNTRHDITDSTICIFHLAFLRPLLRAVQFPTNNLNLTRATNKLTHCPIVLLTTTIACSRHIRHILQGLPRNTHNRRISDQFPRPTQVQTTHTRFLRHTIHHTHSIANTSRYNTQAFKATYNISSSSNIQNNTTSCHQEPRRRDKLDQNQVFYTLINR
jgi:hypothetical protein